MFIVAFIFLTIEISYSQLWKSSNIKKEFKSWNHEDYQRLFYSFIAATELLQMEIGAKIVE